MKKIVAVVFAVGLFNSCQDMPYPKKEPTLALEESASKKVIPVCGDC